MKSAPALRPSRQSATRIPSVAPTAKPGIPAGPMRARDDGTFLSAHVLRRRPAAGAFGRPPRNPFPFHH